MQGKSISPDMLRSPGGKHVSSDRRALVIGSERKTDEKNGCFAGPRHQRETETMNSVYVLNRMFPGFSVVTAITVAMNGDMRILRGHDAEGGYATAFRSLRSWRRAKAVYLV